MKLKTVRYIKNALLGVLCLCFFVWYVAMMLVVSGHGDITLN